MDDHRRAADARALPRVDPLGFYHPSTEDEVVALIHFASARGLTVRVRGAGHSVPAAIHADARLDGERRGHAAVELLLDELTSTRFDDTRRHVTVGAGCRLGRDPRDPHGRAAGTEGLCVQLERRGWALPNLGGVAHQTVAGFLSTGSAGASTTYDLSACVVSLRLVDGLGRVRVVRRGEALFPAVLVSMGLCGVITEVTLACEPRYDVAGEELVVDGLGPPLQALADGAHGLAALLRREAYARVLWWPQRGVGRFVVWRARRMSPADYDATTGAVGQLRPLRYAPLEAIAGSERAAQGVAGLALGALGGWRRGVARALGPSVGASVVALVEAGGARRAEAALIRGFVPLGAPRPFRDAWHRALPMDDDMDERLVPTSFTELWLPLGAAGEIMRRLDALYRTDPVAAGHFATELYAAPASEAWLSPAYGRESLRINPFWFDRNPGDPRHAVFPRLWATLADLGYRLHWGKALPLDTAASARHLSRQYPRWHDFLRVRQELDPGGLFLTRYWRAHLGLDVAAAPAAPGGAGPDDAPGRTPSPAAPVPLRRDTFLAEPLAQRRRWPFVVQLDAVDAGFADTAAEHFDATASIAAPPAAVFALFRDIPRTGEWFPGFVGCDRRTPDQGAGSVYDETFVFMSVRVRVLEEDAPSQWVAAVEAASLPLASRMIMRVRLDPEGPGTRLVWRVAYDPLPAVRPLSPALKRPFEALFQRGADGLARWFVAHGAAERA